MVHERRVVDEFTHQAERFNVAPVYTTTETLQALIDVLPLDAQSAWLEVACGPGIVSRALAPRVGQVVGMDLTPAMIEVARREAAALSLTNARFAVGDATAIDRPAGQFDGAVTRFSLHHVPLPGRVVAEMARVVRPGGWVCLADHSTADDVDAFAWHQEIERLRDPSHWACLTPAQHRQLGVQAGLELREERLISFAMDFEEWLQRGSGGPNAAALIVQALSMRPHGARGFAVRPAEFGRSLNLLYHITLWQRAV